MLTASSLLPCTKLSTISTPRIFWLSIGAIIPLEVWLLRQEWLIRTTTSLSMNLPSVERTMPSLRTVAQLPYARGAPATSPVDYEQHEPTITDN